MGQKWLLFGLPVGLMPLFILLFIYLFIPLFPFGFESIMMCSGSHVGICWSISSKHYSKSWTIWYVTSIKNEQSKTAFWHTKMRTVFLKAEL